ncbi:hypothetical protein HPB48_007475 [Haemaphysalis longicornis]|uniref:Uncharacterized protein n=1 Tax=Haemaphysalis longicornis TaxID=44386 RepID=A0A9J6GF17_HAELO|nr:hypothetical protein HPB48_007475 [Haemaphysalis longicornis]
MEGGVKEEGRPGQSVLAPLRSFNFRVARGGEPNCESRIRTAGQERQSRAGVPGRTGGMRDAVRRSSPALTRRLVRPRWSIGWQYGIADALHGLAQKSPSAGGSGGSNDVEASDGKKDWHDRALMSREAEAKGAGEQGAAFFLPAGLDKKKDELYKVNGFNALASDFIALNRSLPDIRHPG